MNEITNFLSVWGAVAATIAIMWNVYNSLQDKGKIKVEAMIGKLVPDGTKKNYFVVILTNIGKRPILVKSITVEKKTSKEDQRRLFLITEGLPRMLKESEFHTELFHDIDSIVTPNMKMIYAEDSRNKKYKISKRNLKNILKHKTIISSF